MEEEYVAALEAFELRGSPVLGEDAEDVDDLPTEQESPREVREKYLKVMRELGLVTDETHAVLMQSHDDLECARDELSRHYLSTTLKRSDVEELLEEEKWVDDGIDELRREREAFEADRVAWVEARQRMELHQREWNAEQALFEEERAAWEADRVVVQQQRVRSGCDLQGQLAEVRQQRETARGVLVQLTERLKRMQYERHTAQTVSTLEWELKRKCSDLDLELEAQQRRARKAVAAVDRELHQLQRTIPTLAHEAARWKEIGDGLHCRAREEGEGLAAASRGLIERIEDLEQQAAQLQERKSVAQEKAVALEVCEGSVARDLATVQQRCEDDYTALAEERRLVEREMWAVQREGVRRTGDRDRLVVEGSDRCVSNTPLATFKVRVVTKREGVSLGGLPVAVLPASPGVEVLGDLVQTTRDDGVACFTNLMVVTKKPGPATLAATLCAAHNIGPLSTTFTLTVHPKAATLELTAHLHSRTGMVKGRIHLHEDGAGWGAHPLHLRLAFKDKVVGTAEVLLDQDGVVDFYGLCVPPGLPLAPTNNFTLHVQSPSLSASAPFRDGHVQYTELFENLQASPLSSWTFETASEEVAPPPPPTATAVAISDTDPMMVVVGHSQGWCVYEHVAGGWSRIASTALPESVSAVAWVPSALLLAAGAVVTVHSPKRSFDVSHAVPFPSPVRHISANDVTRVAVSLEHEVQVWDIPSSTPMAVLPATEAHFLSPTLLVGATPSAFTVWDLPTTAARHVWEGDIAAIATAPPSTVAVAEPQGAIRLVREPFVASRWLGDHSGVHRLSFASSAFLMSAAPHEVHVWDVLAEAKAITVPAPGTSALACRMLSPTRLHLHLFPPSPRAFLFTSSVRSHPTPAWSDEEARNLSSESFDNTTPSVRFTGFLKANGIEPPTPCNEHTMRQTVVTFLTRCKQHRLPYKNWWSPTPPQP
eukprot:Sspe_Gene.16626::Locus_5867_Transcript_1_1_Confidence_1.000_Length_3250::g.16626::m.16626